VIKEKLDEIKTEKNIEKAGTFKKCEGCPFEYCTNACPIQYQLEKRKSNKGDRE